jgi:hypothetical protein
MENESGAAQIAGETRMKCWCCQGPFWPIFQAKFLRYTIASQTKTKL